MMGTPHPKNRDGVDEDDPARWARALARIFSSLVAATTGSAVGNATADTAAGPAATASKATSTASLTTHVTLSNEAPAAASAAALRPDPATVPARRVVMLLHAVAAFAATPRSSGATQLSDPDRALARFARDESHLSGFASPAVREILRAELAADRVAPRALQDHASGVGREAFRRCLDRACRGYVPLALVQRAAEVFLRRRAEQTRIRRLCAKYPDKFFPRPRKMVVRDIVVSPTLSSPGSDHGRSRLRQRRHRYPPGHNSPALQAPSTFGARIALCVHCTADRLAAPDTTSGATGTRLENLVHSWCDAPHEHAHPLPLPTTKPSPDQEKKDAALVSIAVWPAPAEQTGGRSKTRELQAARAAAQSFVKRCTSQRSRLRLAIALCGWQDDRRSDDGVQTSANTAGGAEEGEHQYPINALRNKAMDVARERWAAPAVAPPLETAVTKSVENEVSKMVPAACRRYTGRSLRSLR